MAERAEQFQVGLLIQAKSSWLNRDSMTTHRQLRALAKAKKDSDATSTHSSECAICLMSIAVSTQHRLKSSPESNMHSLVNPFSSLPVPTSGIINAFVRC